MTREPLYLCAADEEDLDSLLAIEQRSFSHPWSRRSFRDALASGRALTLVLRAPSSPPDPGHGIRAYCVIETVRDEVYIHDLAVHPEHRRRGLARRLLRLALEIAARRGAETAWLEVRASNWAALELYRSLGFAALSVRRDYYARPREDALVLRRAGLAVGAAAGHP